MSAPSAPPNEEDHVIRSPELPFVSSIVGGLFAGRSVVVSGMVLPGFASDSKKFAIDFCCGLLIDGDHMDNKALHFNPRFDTKSGWFGGPSDDKLVINAFVSGSWGTEERFDNPFKEGEPFMIRILVLEKYFKISAGGRHVCDFPHRIPVDQIRTISIKGNIRVDYVEFQPPITADGEVHKIGTGAAPKEEKVTTVNKPNIPFNFVLPPGGFVNPQSARFIITPFLSSERFCINFMRKQEYLFHYRVDMPNPTQKIKAAVIRNSSYDNVKWRTEERTFGTFPFNKGITHDIVFTAYGKSVTVDVDGSPFIKFVYRDGDAPDQVDAITVTGDVLLHRFEHKV